MKQKNILFLFSDQHNATAMGCSGNGEVKTPHLDSLARRGVRFDNAYANNPICTPSRMCFLSGQYTHNHGYYGLMGPRPEQLPHLFSHFREQGYRTGWFGKSHTPAGWLSDCDARGDALGYETRLSEEDADKMEGLQGRNDDDYTRYLKEKGLLPLREDKVLREQYRRFGHSRGQGVDAVCGELPADETVEAWCAAESLKFIGRCREEGKPFVCWTTMPHPHQGYAPARRFWELYDEDELTLPPNADSDFSRRHPAARKAREYYQTNREWVLYEPSDWESVRRRVLKGYYACVSQVDDAVGRIVAGLREMGLEEDTIIVYTSDHGEFAGEHGMIEKAPGIAFRCVTRIPFIISCPGMIPEGEVRRSLIESVDLLPTLASLCGLPPADWVDGCDAGGVLFGDRPVKEIAVTENPLSKTVHTERYKYTHYPPEICGGGECGELYDTIEDPWEMNNLYGDPAYGKVAAELKEKLLNWLISTARNVTVGPAPYVWKGRDYGTWDLAGQLYDRDGRLGRNYYEKVLGYKDGKTTKVNPVNYL